MTAALTVPAVDLQAILDGRQWLYLAPEKVREVRSGYKNAPWVPLSESFYKDMPEAAIQRRIGLGQIAEVRERSVPVVPPAPVTCPECGGERRFSVYCERCDGSGTVPAPLLLCAEQCRVVRIDDAETPWRLPMALDNAYVERRTAGLVLVPQPTYLPVVDGTQHVPDECVYLYASGTVALLNAVSGFERRIVTDEPYAPLLEPGGLLVMWDRADILETPIPRMVNQHREKLSKRFDIPLSVGTGFTEVTLP